MCEHDLKLESLEYLDDILTMKLLEKRIILIHGEINEDLAHKVVKELLYLSCSSEPINVILTSNGGSVYEGLLIYNTIKDLVSKGMNISIDVRGLAASMGLIILQAASVRITNKYTRFLIHEMSDVCHGKTSQIEDETIEAKKLNDMLRNIIAERSKKTSEDIEQIIKRKDVWLSAEEALEWGLIDKIV